MRRPEITQVDIGIDPSLVSSELQAVFERIWLESIFQRILTFNNKITREDLESFLSLHGVCGYEQKNKAELSGELGIKEEKLQRRLRVVRNVIRYVANLELMQVEQWLKQEEQGTQASEPKQQGEEESLTLEVLNLPYLIRVKLERCEAYTLDMLSELSYVELHARLRKVGVPPIVCYVYLRDTVQKTQEFLTNVEWHNHFLRQLHRWTRQVRASSSFQADAKKYELELTEASAHHFINREEVQSLLNKGLEYRLKLYTSWPKKSLDLYLDDSDLLELLRQVDSVLRTLEEAGKTAFPLISPMDIDDLENLRWKLETIADERD